MAKPKHRLKVFRTPIGFHDAYVAAPSQKAALEAWGVDTNLFARGAAEQVADPDLMKEPLAKPGVVFKRLRGTETEQIAALGEAEAERARARAKRPRAIAAKAASQPKRKPRKLPKPSGTELERAEAVLAEAEKRQRRDIEAIDKELEALKRRKRDLLRRHERERDELTEATRRERKRYERSLRDWQKAGAG